MKKKKFDGVIISVRFSKEEFKSLEKVCKHYRTNGKLSAGIRLAIEDVAKQIASFPKFAVMAEVTEGEHPSDESPSQPING
jgi:hypothetical protein